MRLLSLKVYCATVEPVLARAGERPTARELELELIEIDDDLAHGLLASAPQAELFAAWLAAGYRGLVLADRKEWVSFGWLASPSSPPAVHLPSWADGQFWIFNCRTHDGRRGEGHYQRLLVELVRLAGRLGSPEDVVFIDTISSNLPSVRAIERVGFEPAGRILQLEVSRLGLRPSLPLGVPRGRPPTSR